MFPAKENVYKGGMNVLKYTRNILTLIITNSVILTNITPKLKLKMKNCFSLKGCLIINAPEMATLRNKRKLVPVKRDNHQEHPRNNQSRDTNVPILIESNIIQVAE